MFIDIKNYLINEVENLDIEAYKEAVGNADIAFANGKFENAVSWYDKALKEAPNDEYSLSKAGTALVSISKFEEAFGYFQRAVEAGPENGDNLFNLANAYFFSGDISKAMEYYTQAEIKKCSDDVKARIYYQMALMCSIKMDYSNALVNYQKYEDADKTGQAAIDTEVIAERVSLYIKLEDYENALKYTMKWLSLAPSDLRCYIVYFNLLMAEEQYDKALSALDDAEKYAVKSPEEQYAVDVSRANFYAAAAGTEIDKDSNFNDKAYELMNQLVVSEYGSPEEKNELVLALGELCISMQKVDEAIQLMQMLTEESETAEEDAAPAGELSFEADPAEVDAVMTSQLAAMEAKVASGEISEDLGDNVPVNYDENGNPVRDYPDGIFGEDENGYKLPEFEGVDMKALEEQDAEDERIAKAVFKAKVNFTLLTCYAFKEDYEQTLKYARLVKNTPDNTYYSFFGRYSEAYAIKKLAQQGKQFTKEQADRKYQEELAFFRAQMLKANEDSAYALIFRTRMYAETGKFDKALELAELMTDSDKAALVQYVDECRKEQGES